MTQAIHDILGFVILELNMQAVFDAELHLDRVVAVWRHPERVYPNFPLLHNLRHPSGYCDAQEVSDYRVR